MSSAPAGMPGENTPLVDAPDSERSWQFSKKQMFVFLLLMQILTNFDQGFIANALLAISQDLKMSPVQMGTLSSVHYLGIMCISSLGGYILQRHSEHIRRILTVSFLFNGVFLLIHGAAWDFYSLCLLRLSVGLSHAIGFVYYPVWVNSHADKDQCTMWMAVMQGIASLSTVASYAVSGLVVWHAGVSWRWLFVVQGFGVLGCMAILNLHVPSHLLKVIGTSTPGKAEASNEGSYLSTILQLRNYPLFWLISMALSAVYFVGTAANYWAMPVLKKVLNVSEVDVTTAVTIVGATGPLGGVLLSGLLFDKLVPGGYKNRLRSLQVTVCLTVAVNICIPWIFFLLPTSFVMVSFMLWVVFFFGGAVVPVFMGLVLEAVPPHMQLAASGVFNVISNGLGYFLGPFLVGAFVEKYGELTGWRFLFGWWETAVLFTVLALMHVSTSKELAASPCPETSA